MENRSQLFLVVAIVLLSVMVPTMGGCDISPVEATRILGADGVSNIQLTGYGWFECGRDDTFSNGFTGRKNGQNVTGVLCGGWLKGDTIRYK